MKKLILASIVCAFIAGPALANDFQTEQTATLDRINAKMEKFKDDTTKMEFLTQKKSCVEAATDVNGVQECIAKFHPDQLKKAASATH